MIKLLLVDDHELVRTGIRRILEDVADFDVVGEAINGEDAVKFCRNNAPDLVLMDMSMPGMGGIEATKQILRFSEDTRVIVLSVHKENPIPAKVMQMGAFGYLTKDSDPQEMIKAIYKVGSGQKYVSPDIAQQIALGQLNLQDGNPFESLSDRELEITMMLTKGAKVPDIAVSLNISAKTVNTYRYRMFEKLNVSTDVELTHLALRHKLIQSEQL
ncbi:UvrY/SirA/GacA family response regulator transcription factor [Paraglaciecola aquimarina]|uniref:UvrY/SirA/GacA family response regulator transcription factor n=1 Tax=Paraglaciecola aquimarina TaxID=1235557 RepID=A0ABU3SYC2_9ALTE|nr:UvrY/SirA/GacA family response regulator transcription factor [Paraglaciecola aquimarina]MDU0355019.1 UvrY/SirA/GacA family response regulator transcription factor [Paraglaciecola aquimarina]